MDIRDGYLYLDRKWVNNDQVRLTFDMPVRRIYANTAVRADAGYVCLMRGPMVYCFESVDNGGELSALRIPEDAVISAKICDAGSLKDLVLLQAEGFRMHSPESLYSEEKPHAEKARLQAVPYFTWGNRGVGDMRVWILE